MVTKVNRPIRASVQQTFGPDRVSILYRHTRRYDFRTCLHAGQEFPNKYGIRRGKMTPKSYTIANEEMLRPPFNRAMQVLDRSLFHKRIRTLAAVIHDQTLISRIRSDLWKDALHMERVSCIKPMRFADGRETGQKCIVLKPDIKEEDSSTWSPKLAELVAAHQVSLEPWNYDLNYADWTYLDIMTSVLPIEAQDEIPQGFSAVGHIAHFNLREQFLPYKYVIGAVILDKHPQIRTVINKIEKVGAEDQFRTFNYEVLAGEDDMAVEVREQDCLFRFDYSKVYWNPRLETEHRRLVNIFKPGEAIADVMAGVGPFAIPAGKKNCFMYANDLNPKSHASLKDAIARNKVSRYVRPYNEDGLKFIRSAADEIFHTDYVVENTPVDKASRHKSAKSLQTAQGSQKRTFFHQPKVFSHYVLNLPDSALSFLPAFIGLHTSRSAFFSANPDIKLPMIHVYCFSTKSQDNVKEKEAICKEISSRIGYKMRPGKTGDEVSDGEVDIWDVRDVAPVKRMFCASFRLPAEVAFTMAHA